MFDTVRNNKKLAQIILGLVSLTFAFFGIEAYMQSPGSAGEVARVGKIRVSQGEFAEAQRNQQDRMREVLGKQFDPKMLDNPEARRAVLESVINQKLLALEANGARLGVSDEQLREFISTAPALQENGQFSSAKYDALVRSRGMSREGFEQTLRQDLVQQQLVGAITESGFSAKTLAEHWVALQIEEREFAQIQIKPEQFVAQVKLAPDAVQKHYEANRAQFETPEQVKAEFVTLSLDSLMQQISVTEDEIKSWYDGHPDRYQQAEERRASHILIPLAKDAPEAEQKAARDKADSLLKAVRANPDDFARIARENSKDPGSAQNGGDLGFFARGAMVKPFEDAAFALKVNGISDVVQSDFGLHVIKLSEIKPAKSRPIDEVRGEIADELKRAAAGRKYAEAAEQFTNAVYEQSDSLKPVIEKFKLAAQTTDWIGKNGQGAGKLSNPKVIAALFGDDAIKNKRNTEAIEIAPNTLVSARVLEHKPAALRSLEEVRADIEKQLTLVEAGKLAQQDATARLEKLKKGEAVDIAWSEARKITRNGLPGVSPEGVRALFKVSPEKLPAYGMAESPIAGTYLYKVTAINKPAIKPDDPRLKSAQSQLAQASGGAELDAYLAALRTRYKVEVNLAALEARQQP